MLTFITGLKERFRLDLSFSYEKLCLNRSKADYRAYKSNNIFSNVLDHVVGLLEILRKEEVAQGFISLSESFPLTPVSLCGTSE